MKNACSFRVEPWAGDLRVGDHEFVIGSHTVEDPDEALGRSLASAAAEGGITITDGDPPSDHIESDEDSLAAQDAAIESGDWQRSNLETFIVERQTLIREARSTLADDESGLSQKAQKRLEHAVATWKAQLDETKAALEEAEE